MSDARKRSLGQFLTPLPVVDFCLDALQWLEECCPVSRPRTRKIMDPACGDGIFLRRAMERGLAQPDNVYGMDTDASLRESWQRQGLDSGAGPWLGVADGLLAEAVCGRPVAQGGFDWVVGNPPYAGAGLKDADAETLRLIVERYELARTRNGRPASGPEAVRRLPIEVLFLERFVRLCRPGGLLAVILPEGIFANARWRFVRQWLLERLTVQAVVGLPRSAFRAGGITARTCVLVARHRRASPGHQVALAEVNHIGPEPEPNELPELLEAWRRGEGAGEQERPWATGRQP